MKIFSIAIIWIISLFSIANVEGYQNYYYNNYYDNNYYNSQYYYSYPTYQTNSERNCYTATNGSYVECTYPTYQSYYNSYNSSYYRYDWYNNSYYSPSYIPTNTPYSSSISSDGNITQKPEILSDNYYTSGGIEQNLNFPLGIKESELLQETINSFSFKNSKNQQMYTNLVQQDAQTRELILQLYKTWEISEYQSNGIIKNYNTFIYHINKYFSLLQLQERIASLQNDPDTAQSILSHYKSAKTSFDRVKTILLNRKFQ